jgi:hypothetical protein
MSGVAAGAVTASTRAASAVIASRSRAGTRSRNSSTVTVAVPLARFTRHRPATKPSSSTLPGKTFSILKRSRRSPSDMIRVRSSWDRIRLSYSGTSRAGAGTSGPGRGPSGRSNSSRPCSSAKTRSRSRIGPMTSRSRVSPDQACTSWTVAGPNAARYRSTMAASDGRSASGRPSHTSAGVCRARPDFPQTARGGTCTSGTRARTTWASASAGRPGQSWVSSSPSSAKVNGSSVVRAWPAAATAVRSTPGSRLPKLLARARSRTGWTSGRSVSASSALTRWMVPRMSAIRTTSRLISRRARSSGRKPSSRASRP